MCSKNTGTKNQAPNEHPEDQEDRISHLDVVCKRIYEVRRVIRKAKVDWEYIRKLTTDKRFRRVDNWSDDPATGVFLETRVKKASWHWDWNWYLHQPELNISAETEPTTRSLDDESAAKLRSAVQSCLTNPKLSKSNMTKDQKLALKKLTEGKDIVIFPADKGNATVVLNKEDYNQKMNDLLKDARYKQMKSNTTTKLEKKVVDVLKEVESRGGLYSAQKKSLVNNYSTPPQMYGLPKIH